MANDDAIHAKRREPAAPDAPLDLAEAGTQLLETARDMKSGRAGRTLTPGMGASLKQTLLAICEGREMGDHPSPGPTTAQVLRGDVTITAGDHALSLTAGQWGVVPREPHDLVAHTDAVVLLTVTVEHAG